MYLQLDWLPELLGSLPNEAVLGSIGAIALAVITAYLRGNSGTARTQYVRLESALRRLLARLTGSLQPTVSETSRSDVESALRDALGDDPQYVFTDSTYAATDRSGLEQISEQDILRFAPYRPEIYDCEDFAQLFSVSAELVYGVSAIGVVYDWGAGHAYNVVVSDMGAVRLYEPQEGVVLDVGDTLELGEVETSEITYDPENALIVF